MDTDVAADIVAPVAPPARPSLRSLWAIWAGIAFVLSWVLWGLDGSFYARLGVPQSDWPKWSMVEALLGTPALAAWAIVAALWLWWPRRRVVALVALAAVVVGTAGTSLWVRHEAERARGGTPVWPAAVLPFSFSARAVTLMPLDEPLPAGLPARVLLLRDGPDTSVVYDPATGHLWWVGKRLATWSVTAGGQAWG